MVTIQLLNKLGFHQSISYHNGAKGYGLLVGDDITITYDFPSTNKRVKNRKYKFCFNYYDGEKDWFHASPASTKSELERMMRFVDYLIDLKKRGKDIRKLLETYN